MKSMNTSRSVTPRPPVADGTGTAGTAASTVSGIFHARRASGTVDPGDGLSQTEERQASIRDKIAKEMKIKTGTENMLEALLAKNPKHSKDQRIRVESELSSSNRKLAELHHELEEEVLRAQAPAAATQIGRAHV